MSRRQHAGVTEQRKASIHRMEDAQVLFEGGRWRGAMYLAGYAVECRLKYKLMRRWKCRTLAELEEQLSAKGVQAKVYTHNLDALFQLANGWERLRKNTILRDAYVILTTWQPSWRYLADLSSHDEAEEFLEAAKGVVSWIENNL